jgi:uncharacterized protein
LVRNHADLPQHAHQIVKKILFHDLALLVPSCDRIEINVEAFVRGLDDRSAFVNGRQDIIAFLRRKWTKELDYRLIKGLWAFTNNRIAVRFAYEWHDDSGHWCRSYGNENWEFNDDGLMRLRFACINDLPIKEEERKYFWPLGRRPDDHPGLSDLGL